MKILIADDHCLFLDGVKYLLNSFYESPKLVEAVNGIEAFQQLAKKNTFDFALIDLRIPGMNGFSILKELSKISSITPIIIISSSEDPDDIKKSLRLGASGFVSKSFTSAELLKAIMTVLNGDIYTNNLQNVPNKRKSWAKQHHITPRQLEVLRLAKKGSHNIDIAKHLFITERTVKAHISSLLSNFHASSRSELIYKANQLGLD
ncbi:response regulator transcription factor [Leucothrix sargassi]|nr:response regulator transcription factor [Leucothrix sargassi]